jgi:hypothetical protein
MDLKSKSAVYVLCYNVLATLVSLKRYLSPLKESLPNKIDNLLTFILYYTTCIVELEHYGFEKLLR